jgi:dienelactone hydrolase
VQPYGLVVPASYTAQGATRHRLDIWFHGRGERLSELNFIQQRRNQVGQFAPQDTFVLHPYGRYCNAFKFAGEVDVLEALDACRRNYRIDDQRTSVRGFSMGGAACWQFAVHYADRWFAANPGAGFAETAEFLRFFQKETLEPTWYERKLWHMYDCTDYAANLLQCPTVAYSGELDTQKQAADIMATALGKEGIDLVHVIGPGTKHRYHPAAAATVEALVDSIAERGRRRVPRSVQLVTYTVKYNRMNWVTIDGMQEHWEKARVDAHLNGPSSVVLQTTNVSDLALDMPAGWCPLDPRRPVQLEIDRQTLAAPRPGSDRSWHVQLHRLGNQWQLGARTENGLRKRHNLQGPIDDALMDSFVFVRPTGHSEHPAVDQWVTAELGRAIEHWRRQFRGEARVVDDTALTDEQIASSNLVLWGDPASNAVLHRIADRLPIGWQADQITVGSDTYPADHHALIMIYPNPLNLERYVVVNSSFTYREFAYLNNARQVPKLPDWAVVDLRTPPDTLWPGKIAAADFFDEHWQLRPPHQSH